MKEETSAKFLILFNQLKNAVNNSPRNVAWLTKEKPELQKLAYDLDSIYTDINNYLGTKDVKHSFVPKPFIPAWTEYETYYCKPVAEAAEPERQRVRQKLEELAEELERRAIENGEDPVKYWENLSELLGKQVGQLFDPLTDNPASLMKELQDFVYDVINDRLFEDEFYDKALGAWYFFEKTIGVDLEGIYKRWKNSPELFIPTVTESTKADSLIDLYNEAVRSYVFGSKIASVAMCRALLEHILTEHYSLQEKNLEKIIILAEEKFPNLKKLNMRHKKNLANDILHEYEKRPEVEDKAVVDFLRALKYLVERKPPKRR
jgi:hypothetical protein